MAPESVKIPAPDLATPPLVMAPEIVTGEPLATVMVLVAPARFTEPEIVISPVKVVPAPNDSVPEESVKLFAKLRAVASVEVSVRLPFTFTVPVPSERLFPTRKVPAVVVVPPV